jgi:hypothetical protein
LTVTEQIKANLANIEDMVNRTRTLVSGLEELTAKLIGSAEVPAKATKKAGKAPPVTPVAPAAEKKPRKPRADAGQKRGPRKNKVVPTSLPSEAEIRATATCPHCEKLLKDCICGK